MAVAVGVIFVAFVYPGQAPVPCSASTWIPDNTIPVTGGHWYCSETIEPQLTGTCGPGIGTFNGTAIWTNFDGYSFSVHLFRFCIGVNDLGLNASVTKPLGGVFNITIDRGPAYWIAWHNWTSPQNDTGFQWQPNPSVFGNPQWNVSLLIAPR